MNTEKHDLKFQAGFGNTFVSEKEEGAVPQNQNSPQFHNLGLYPEQLSGSAFTAPRTENLKTWLYRIRPSVIHSEFIHTKTYSFFQTPHFASTPATPPTQMRWDPLPYPEQKYDFLESIKTMMGNGGPNDKKGSAIHLYAAQKSMENKVFLNADGDFIIVPEEGNLKLTTELGKLFISPGEIALIPRGIKWKVDLENNKKARGYICENFGHPFKLPELGPIGANGLANPRHFLAPTAFFEEKNSEHELIMKFNGEFWSATLPHSPFDVVGWTGNYVPYQYDLKLFNTINTVSFDHPDPSIFTVLTSPSGTPGVANIDFVIFPERWMVAEHTFRPPYYHRNIMSEFMGLIYGEYDAKKEGFQPGGSSLHNCFSAHGPDADTYEKASHQEIKPERYKGTLAFMFETSLSFQVTEFALHATHRQKDYLDCWQGLKALYK